MKLNYTDSSWFPLKNFSKSECHFDWMMGANLFRGIKDAISGTPINKYDTVFWNRTLKSNIKLDTYNSIIKNNDVIGMDKLKSLGIPLDIKL